MRFFLLTLSGVTIDEHIATRCFSHTDIVI